jgi:predicted NAD/FAD-binding protein
MDADVIVVGSGIAGLSSAFHILKHSTRTVVLVESGAELGGHCLTVVHDGELVDLGFQVFNRETYPTLCSLYCQLGIDPVASDMSFATDVDGFCVKYGSEVRPFLMWLKRSPAEVFEFVTSKSRFHSQALDALTSPTSYPLALGEFFAGYSKVFYQRWIVPFASAVWSLREADVAEFDVQTFLRFMLNHGFLSWATLQWLTLRGGAREEVETFVSCFDFC